MIDRRYAINWNKVGRFPENGQTAKFNLFVNISLYMVYNYKMLLNDCVNLKLKKLLYES